MILEIQHETCLEYSEPVIESVTEARMEPPSDLDQSVRSFRLSINPVAEIARFGDGFGNRVHHFNILPSCREIRILAMAAVETHPRSRALNACRARYPLEQEAIELDALGFLSMRGPVRHSQWLADLVEMLRPSPGTPLPEVVLSLAAYIREHFEYAKDVTLASSPVDDLLRAGKGVCQDFTHLLIGLSRSLGIPARYISGYIHRPHKESQSHAWCEVWLPEIGWFGIDPTNNCEINDHFVKVAIGRDFTDVQPNKGVYRGNAQERISVRVETRTLDRLPSLSWQDSAPSFDVPLTPIASRSYCHAACDGDSHQQQQ